LIQHHAKVNEEDVYNKTPLMYAIDNKSLPVIKLLVENGANMNHDNIIFTKVFKTKDLTIIKYFIEQNISIPFNRITECYEIINKFPIDKKIPIFKCLVQNNSDFFSINVLIEIIRENQIEIIKLLIENNFNFNIKDENEKTPLDYAILFNQQTIVRYLKK
ncbi:ankyrin, partial [Piromyces finnis]